VTVLRLPLLALVLVLLGGCVTPGDVRDVADLVQRFGDDLEDKSKTLADVAAAAHATAARIDDVADRALERTESVLTAGESAGLAGALSTAAAVVLHVVQNRSRAKERRTHVRRAEDRARAGDVAERPP